MLMFGAVASAQTQIRDDRYRIGYQDTIDIQVFRQPGLSQRVNVNSDGTIHLYRLKEPVVAVCKTERELADDIAAAYSKEYLRNPEVNVVAVEQRSQSFAIIGAVKKPGNYYVNRQIHLLELLALAEGQSEDAGSRILVARTGSTSHCSMNETVNPDGSLGDSISLLDYTLKDIIELKKTLILKPGDIVSVASADVVFVYGNVNKQGQVTMREPLTLTQAMASSEGLKPATRKDNMLVLRQKPGSIEREEFIFDLREIDQRKVADPILEPNDVVAVGEDRTKSILNSIGKSLTNGIPSIFYRIP